MDKNMQVESFVGPRLSELVKSVNRFISGKKVVNLFYQVKKGEHCVLVLFDPKNRNK